MLAAFTQSKFISSPIFLHQSVTHLLFELGIDAAISA
jgi:membrane associated rhomboid family serine protease